MKKFIILLFPIMSYGQISLNNLTYTPKNVVTKVVRTPSSIFSNRTEYTTTVYHTIQNVPTITVIRSSSKAANNLNYQINNLNKYKPDYKPIQVFK